MSKTHIPMGVITASWLAVPFAALGAPPALTLISIPVGAYSATLPDLDHPHSLPTWCLPPVSNTVSWLIRGAPYNVGVGPWGRSGWLLPEALTISTGHRRETHTETFAIVLGALVGLLLWPLMGPWSWMFGAQVTGGCLTHCYGDLRTTGGLRHRSGKGRRTIGRVMDVDSPHEHLLRATVYRPVAIASLIASVLLIDYLSGGVL